MQADGNSVGQDQATSNWWYRTAAERGEGGGHDLAVMPINGTGVVQDCAAAAIQLHRKAAD